DARPVAALVPPRRVDAAVVSADEQVDAVAGLGNRTHRRTPREDTADVPPRVVQARPVAALVPPGGVHATVVARDERVEIAGAARRDRNRCTGREEPTDR